tara:strand:- start:291 stop:1925 length:1635 start_codon:yes stop_codon:yes gene_type:complete
MVNAVFTLIALACGAYVATFLARKAASARRDRALAASLPRLVELYRSGADPEAKRRLEALKPAPSYVAQVGSSLAAEGLEAPARQLLSQAEAAGRDSSGRLYFSALGYSALGDDESAAASLERLSELGRLGAAQSLDMARLAAQRGHDDLALDFFRRRLDLVPDDLETCCELGVFFLDHDRAEEAIPVLEHGMGRLRRMLERGDHWITGAESYEQLEAQLSGIHHEAVSRTSSAEKAIDAHVSLGALDTQAGINYTLMGYSLLVDSQARPRRVDLPSQEALLEAAEANPEPIARLEDLGFHRLREHDTAGAIAAFRESLAIRHSFPALVGLGAALDANHYPPQERLAYAIRTTPSVPRLAELCPQWTSMTAYERGYLNLCVAPMAWAVEAILAEAGGLFLVALDAKTTDRPEFEDVTGLVADDDGRRYDAVGGMALNAFSVTRSEELYKVDPMTGWTLAHEFGHQVLNVSSDELWEEVEELLARYRDLGFVGTSYGLKNSHELFACGYERYAIRQANPDLPLDEIHDCDREYGLDAFFRELARP